MDDEGRNESGVACAQLFCYVTVLLFLLRERMDFYLEPLYLRDLDGVFSHEKFFFIVFS